MDATYRTYQLPWETGQEQENRFRRTYWAVLLFVLVLCVAVPFLTVPEVDPSQQEEIPQRFAKLLLEKKPPPPPPVEEPKVEKVIPEKAPEKVVEVQKPVEEPQPVEKAREKAAQAGLLPFADQLAELRDDAALDNIMTDNQLNESAGDAERVERAMIMSKAEGSGGINTGSMSRNTGGGSLEGRNTTKIASPVVVAAGPSVQKGGSAPSRSREEIELVFEKNKGAIFALYNRALRRDPTLQGKLVLELTIDPTGKVTACKVVSSELADAEMERKLVQRVKLFRFKEKDVATITTTKPIDFFPA